MFCRILEILIVSLKIYLFRNKNRSFFIFLLLNWNWNDKLGDDEDSLPNRTVGGWFSDSEIWFAASEL